MGEVSCRKSEKTNARHRQALPLSNTRSRIAFLSVVRNARTLPLAPPRPPSHSERLVIFGRKFRYATTYFAQSLVAYPPAKRGTQAGSPGADQVLPRNPFTLSSKTNQSSGDGPIPDTAKGTTPDDSHATKQDYGGQANRRKRGGKA